MWPSYLIAGWIFVPFVGIACVLGGYCALVKWIPADTKKDEVRTDFYSARASYYTIGVGLLILTLWAISAIAIRTLAMLKIFRVT